MTTMLATAVLVWAAICFILGVRMGVGFFWSRFVGPRFFPRNYGWRGPGVVQYRGEWPAPLWCALDGAHRWEVIEVNDPEFDYAKWRECKECGRVEDQPEARTPVTPADEEGV